MAVLFRFLLGCGADYSLQDENKETVVHKLAREGRTSWLYKIRAANSFERDRGGILCRLANMANAQGKTPLMLACYKANPSTVEELLSWGGDVSYTLPKKNGTFGWGLLHELAISPERKVDVANLLFSAGLKADGKGINEEILTSGLTADMLTDDFEFKEYVQRELNTCFKVSIPEERRSEIK